MAHPTDELKTDYTDCTDCNDSEPAGITRRAALKAGGTGAAMLAIMGYTPAAVHAQADDDGIETTPNTDLDGLLERNQQWSEDLVEDFFADVQDTQEPSAVTVTCSDSRVSQAGMFLTHLETGEVFEPSNIGNKVSTFVDDEEVVDGSFLYGLETLDADQGVVVGHTSCGAVAAAYDIVIECGVDALPDPDEEQIELEAEPGIVQEIEKLVEIVADGLQCDAIDPNADDELVVNQLVEYNVNQQIQFLLDSDEVSDDRELYGFVYDFQEVYSDESGRTILVNVNGETDPNALREQVTDGFEDFVQTLL